MKQGKQKAPAQFIRMPDGSVRVVSIKEPAKTVSAPPKKAKKYFKLPKRKPKTKRPDTKQIPHTNVNQINISLKVPKINFKRAIKKAPKPTRKQLYFTLPIIILLIGVGWFFTKSNNKSSTKSTNVLSAVDTQNKKTLPREKPKFKILYPLGSEKEIVGDVVRSTPDNVAPGYRYFDDIGGVVVSITQQQLPESFKPDTATKLASMAKDFQATNVIKIDNNIIYHGLSEKTKQQSLIFTKDNLLIFIISETKISDDAWVGYILGLK